MNAIVSGTRERLARALCEIDGLVWWTDGIPAVYYEKADALIGTDFWSPIYASVVREAAAEAWNEGHEEGCVMPHGCVAHENPYR